MAVFYNKEKSKLGTVTGTIIHLPRQLAEDQDPTTGSSRDIVPAGYLRCDGRILSASLFPALAIILGTGVNSKFKKDEITLTDTQFQLPDFRMKNVRHTNASDVGRYNDLYVTLDDGRQQIKAGVGLEVVQRAPSPWEVEFTGDFYLPSQTIDLQSRPQFTRSQGNQVATAGVDNTQIQPHMHYSTTRRFRQNHAGADNSQLAYKSVTTRSSLDICQWFAHSRQELCYFAADGRLNRDPSWDNPWPEGAWDWGGGCNSCSSYLSQGLCLWPTCHGVTTGNFTADGGCAANVKWSTTGGPGDTLADGSSGQGPDASYNGTGAWQYASGNNGTCAGIGQSADRDEYCFGEIQYAGKYFQNCTPAFLGIGNPLGRMWTEDTPLTPNYTYPTVPFANPGFYQASGVLQEGYAAGLNLTTRVGRFGNEALHTHIVPFEVEPHTYQIITDAVNITAYGTISSQISIQINENKKADEFIQPFILTEYIIKT